MADEDDNFGRPDPRKEAAQYIEEKRIDALFQELGTRLIYARAHDPNDFLVSVLEEMKGNKKKNVPTPFFTDKDITTLFEMFDPTGKGSISHEQYQQALMSLGIDKPTVELTLPPSGKVDRRTFTRSMEAEVKALSMT
mmetsp:Transcript_31311/g.36882  ORF Transcript_31311/g.36882 Transcript_31311/m.36882 type:complete len:138 (+) Transcript_31311:15-428(+)